MVAGTYDHHTFSFWNSACAGLLFRVSALYLFTVLTMKISKAQQSVIAVAAGLLLLALLKQNYFFLIAAGIIAIGFFSPAMSKAVHVSWMSLSKILGWISGHIILFILFYFFLTPMALLRRLTGKKEMIKKFSGKETSLFSERNHIYSKEDFLNPW